MRYKKLIYCLILILTTLMMLWLLPLLVNKLTYKPDHYPFVYYSTMLEELAIIDYGNKEYPMTNKNGDSFTTAEMDSLLPMLNYRQLMNDGRMPDSIKGQEMNPRMLRMTSFTFRYNPSETKTPGNGLYILFESMPKRVGLTMPEDVFRMKNNIEFINTESNTVNETKSREFQSELEKQGYSFPSQWFAGNPNPRKSYDEGYFSLDNKGQLFHIKMVNGRSYIKNTHIGEKIDIGYFSMLEVADKRFYGFLFSNQGDIYIIQNESGNYQAMKLDIDPIDLKKDQVFIMGNLFEWTVSVVKPEEKLCYGLDNNSLKQIDNYSMKREPDKWDKVVKWIFPAYLTIESKYSNFLVPQIHYVGVYAFILNILLSVCYVLILSESRKVKIYKSLYILVTGIAGFLALLILPKSKKS
ncbi:DUF4857 domain-containing protein [Dysgonomonas sp. Marseille-P4677]|uniref:DUF4857 domain-containing protein n=1 Tax=Dysgonomonas sp. Marseille-P4677 TaxID=2364790 RepID=UPI001913823A|nr:DUF4857 domain-containing protein [Dysgonomonas sp. Marseille-P4677]MBK5720971.1 DUF4857 domain-containing protein [Dysgonomonas sp. Marseille-P4677]